MGMRSAITHRAILASSILARERILLAIDLGESLLREHDDLSAEYGSLYRANGERARGRRRGLRFRIAEIETEPEFRRAWSERERRNTLSSMWPLIAAMVPPR